MKTIEGTVRCVSQGCARITLDEAGPDGKSKLERDFSSFNVRPEKGDRVHVHFNGTKVASIEVITEEVAVSA